MCIHTEKSAREAGRQLAHQLLEAGYISGDLKRAFADEAQKTIAKEGFYEDNKHFANEAVKALTAQQPVYVGPTEFAG